MQLVEDIWDSIAADADADSLPVSDEEKAMLDERLADLEANPGDGAPWPEVRARIIQRLKQVPAFIVRPFAEADVPEAFAWYEEQAQGLGHEFLRALDVCYAMIERWPNRTPSSIGVSAGPCCGASHIWSTIGQGRP